MRQAPSLQREAQLVAGARLVWLCVACVWWWWWWCVCVCVRVCVCAHTHMCVRVCMHIISVWRLARCPHHTLGLRIGVQWLCFLNHRKKKRAEFKQLRAILGGV